MIFTRHLFAGCPPLRKRCLRSWLLPARVVTLLLTAAFPAGVAGAAPAPAAHDNEAVQSWVQSRRQAIFDELKAFLSLPNTSRQLPAIEANAEALRQMWERRGATVRLLPGPGGPYVFAHLPAAGPASGPRPTILFYAHYDGQPADPDRWHMTAPFSPRLVGSLDDPESRLYGRSASDDKSPIVAMAAAVDALHATGQLPAADLKFIFDPEEEVSSPNLEATLARHASLLAADVLIFADGPVYPTGDPMVVFGTRGIVTLRLTVYGPAEPLHSGHYGNWAPNPAEKLARLLASMKDDQGRILVAGFHDDVLPLGPAEQQALAAAPAVEDRLQRQLLIHRPDGGGRSLQELINLPSLNVRGLASAWVGGQARTIVPATATAEIDIRLVRDLDPAEQVERVRRHARQQGFHVVESEPDAATRRSHARVVAITGDAGIRAWRTPLDTPLSRAVIDAARRGSGGALVLMPTLGGTLPLSRLQDLLDGLPMYGLPMVNADNNQHAPDENLRLGNLWQGVSLYAAAMRLQWPAAPD